ncbi:MAG: 3-oxoacyl-ACP synthase [Bacteroidetes bacterium]|nr:MAG: 3-oxoacyl-ACP synthase [Bacteroidota bacterium]
MIYINGTAAISPQPTLNGNVLLTEIKEQQTNMLQCIEPDYGLFFRPNALRRVSRILKLGWAGAKLCLDDAGINVPGSICLGTGKGCFKSTETFLLSVDKNKEQFVPPSPFIQSAHSSIAAQIAIQTGCQNYNMTYAHRAFSFESALLDAMMLLKEGKYANVLLGGVDEIEEIQFRTFERIGHYKKPGVSNLQLLNDNSQGTIAGEGSTFFLLENQRSTHTYAGIRAVHTFSNPFDTNMIRLEINSFLKKEDLTTEDIDLVLLGLNGYPKFDNVYYELSKTIFLENKQAYYKHLCGEYHTSSAFALWLATNILRKQVVPESIRLNGKPVSELKNILIYNHYRNVNHSLLLVSNSDRPEDTSVSK